MRRRKRSPRHRWRRSARVPTRRPPAARRRSSRSRPTRRGQHRRRPPSAGVRQRQWWHPDPCPDHGRRRGRTEDATTKITDGVKDIEAEDAGKSIKIDDDPAKGIKIEVTSKKDGKDVTQKFEAKNAAELKKKSPEGYKLYQKYAENQVQLNGGAGGVLQVGGGQIQLQFNVMGGAGGIQIVPGGGIAPAPATPVLDQAAINRLTAKMEDSARRIDAVGGGPTLTATPQKAKAELRKEIKTLKQQIDEFAEVARRGGLVYREATMTTPSHAGMSLREILTSGKFYYGAEVVTTRGLPVAGSPADAAARAPRFWPIRGSAGSRSPTIRAGCHAAARLARRTTGRAPAADRAAPDLQGPEPQRPGGCRLALCRRGFREPAGPDRRLPTTGFGGKAGGVFDIDSIGLIALLRSMNDGLRCPAAAATWKRCLQDQILHRLLRFAVQDPRARVGAAILQARAKLAAGAQWFCPSWATTCGSSMKSN